MGHCIVASFLFLLNRYQDTQGAVPHYELASVTGGQM